MCAGHGWVACFHFCSIIMVVGISPPLAFQKIVIKHEGLRQKHPY